ncbi:CRISPR-associated protein, Cse1 family [Dinoroseobacter shibae DFL 12 = DSM 16493]|jgi:CRISPR system Cascade subunit CasA|uniref:CRISPR-associated protein, Cse1 family n=1 Tax=Dinoroseobacter shibae (strain DSM 16493 / NCIMB 14021 / DFL 12) TaxID=398580 RepID=A8LM39_DINSH|nr:CRISPR-associated protein, Cse1 family [Dinoroseobacter shibae DFL 12 = DSM 16493]
MPVNLLSDPIFSAEGGRRLNLPGLFAALACDEVRGFPRLRAHQRAAWHMFRVQLAALALDKAGRAEPPQDEADWHALLVALTEGVAGPWDLTGPDRTKPAFLQPPDPGGLKWEPVATPDALDLLITSRNHDLKSEIAAQAAPEDWVYALISLQTSEGYGGRGNFGIARMNGGSSSRAMLGLAPAGPDGRPDPASWWRRDLALVLRNRNAPTLLTRGGKALLWTLPWPEGRQIPALEMDPLAIEVCRRIRLVARDGTVVAERAASKAARVEAKAFNGVLDDPWAPVNVKDATPKTLTLGEGGRFHYRRMVDLLTGGYWQLPLAARLDEGEVAGNMVLVAEALARGNSKTDGLQSRNVPMPKRVRGLADIRNRIARAAQEQMAEIAAADAALREAVALYAARGDFETVGKPQRQRAAAARERLDATADRIFFDHLWARIAGMDEGDDALAEARANFRAVLVTTARDELTRAFDAIPCARIHAPRARIRARGRLEGALRKANLLEVTHA